MGKMSRIYGQIAMELRANCNGITGNLRLKNKETGTQRRCPVVVELKNYPENEEENNQRTDSSSATNDSARNS